MPNRRDPRLTVEFEALGRIESNIQEYSLDTGYLTSTDGFEFTLYHPDRSRLLGLEMQPVNLLIDGNSQLIGKVEVTEIGDDGSAVHCSGRDYIARLVECNVDPALVLKQGMSLFEALTLATSTVGIDTVVSDDDLAMRNVRTGRSLPNVPRLEVHNLTLEDLKPKPNEGLYEFCNRIVARHGATIQPATARNVLALSTPNYAQPVAYEIIHTDDTRTSAGNNVLRSSARRDYSSFPTHTLFTSKWGTPGSTKRDLSQSYDMTVLAEEFNDEIAQILDGKAVRGRRRPGNSGPLEALEEYRFLYLKDDESRNAAQLERAARRAISERLKDTLSYSVTLQGHDDPRTGALWAVDTMVHVRDDICGLNEPLWIESRTFRYAPGQGPTTDLKCWRPSSFQL
jgi:prophage tail gpP-like protein